MGPGWLEFIAIRRVYMGLWKEGIRGRGISAIGGWQWRRGSRPRLHGGRISTRGQRGEGRRDSWAPLRCARNDMWVVGKEDGDGFPPPFSRGQALRGNNGEREGFPSPRLHGGRISTRGQRGEELRDSWAPLRCARNDMWVVGKEDGDGFPPPSSRVAGSSRE